MLYIIFQFYIKKNILFIEYFLNNKSYVFVLNLNNLKNKIFEFNCNGYEINNSKLQWNNKVNKLFHLNIQKNI